MQIEYIGYFGIIVGIIISLITLLLGIFEYKRQGSQKRAEYFNMMKNKLIENDALQNICTLLDTDDEKLKDINFSNKKIFLSFFEEIAMMMNSKIISKEIVLYMFGYYAIKCWKSKYFWMNNIEKNGFYWLLFNEFASSMDIMREKYREKVNGKYKIMFNNDNYKF